MMHNDGELNISGPLFNYFSCNQAKNLFIRIQEKKIKILQILQILMLIASSGPQFTPRKNLTINVFCLTFCQEHRACLLCELFDRASHIQVTTNSLRKRIRALQIHSFQYSHQGSDQHTPKSFFSPDLIHHVLAGACKPAALALCCPLSD
jgi:hypothetical protein